MSESLQRLAPIARDATDVQLGCGAVSRRRVGQSVGQSVSRSVGQLVGRSVGCLRTSDSQQSA